MSDYIGFTYNGRHSSELGIVRTSNGSRFDENLLPTIQDKTVQIPGGDGTYYFGSYYTQRQFSVSFAFDNLSEEKISELKRHFGDKQIHDLVFDECPYKAYKAKVTGTATIKHIPFDEGKGRERIYKGEGTIQFTCYYPFARCLLKDTDTKEELRKTYPNVDEWWNAAKVQKDMNFGDIEAPFSLEIFGQGQVVTDNGIIKWDLPVEQKAILNTRTGLAIGSDGYGKTKIYNEFLSGDLTMKIPVDARLAKDESTGNNKIFIVNGENLTYDRYYF